MHARLLLILLLLVMYAMVEAQVGVYYRPKQRQRLQTASKHLEVTRRRRNGAQAHRERKKDIFLSRGWGAGGMPFSVLYMNPTRTTVGDAHPPAVLPEAPHTAPIRQHGVAPLQPLARNGMRSRHASQQAIPQLFVSYNWAPMGRRK